MASSKNSVQPTSDEVQENACIVCYKGVEIYSIGQCDHPVCYECSTRMRVLCLQNECPICRQDMPTVIFTETVRPYSEPKENSLLTDKKFKIVFDSEKVQKAYQTLLAHRCPKCEGKTFHTFGQLREHVRRVHQLNFCELCVENLKILTRERRCYTRQELGVHRRQGDPDDRSHRGHPLCQFCDTRFMDNDELYRHLRRNHLYCHFCDADGYDHYYSTYDFLREHFRNEHFLCEEGECYDEKFTAVFRTEIDLKAHRANVHGRAIGKAGVKQARTLELEFTLAPRPRISRSNRPVVREEEQEMGAVGGMLEEMSMCGTQLNTDCMEEFPSLSGSGNVGGSSVPANTQSSKVTATIRSSARGFTINDENFPALGPEATLSLHVNSERPLRSSAVSSKPPNLSIQVNHRPSGFTTRVSSSSSHFEHNFPALSTSTGKGSSAPVMNIASTQWSSGKKPDTKVSVVKQKTDGGSHKQSSSLRPRTFHMDDDFPSLGTEALHRSNKSSTPGAAPAPPPNLPPPPPPVSSSSVINAQSSDSDAVPPPITNTRNKKKKSKSKNNNNGSTNNNNNSNHNNNTDSKKTSVSSNRSHAVEEGGDGGKSKKKSKEPNSKFQSSTEANSNTEKSKKSFTDAMTTSVNASTHNNNNNIDNKVPSPNEKKRDEKKKSGSKAGAPVFSEEEFPSFTRSRPPGFSDVVRVPPGFDAKWPLDCEKRAPPPPPPGFSPVQQQHQQTNGALFPPLGDGYSYVPPSGFVKRNKWLVSAIKNMGSPELNNLQDLSVSFRCGLVSAQQYFDHCQQSMGTNFDELFPELLALLPDIDKQRELWPLYQKRMTETAGKEGPGGGSSIGKKNSSPGKLLECCATCCQVVRSSDLREHRTSHALETQFPILNGQVATGGGLGSNAWHHPIAK